MRSPEIWLLLNESCVNSLDDLTKVRMAESCSILDSNLTPDASTVALDVEACDKPSELLLPSTADLVVSTVKGGDCTSPSPTETVCLDLPVEPIAGPSHADEDESNVPIAAFDYLQEAPEQEDEIDTIDELLDNTLNETQERILQDNKTPERLITRNLYDENILKELVQAKRNEVFLKSNLFSASNDRTHDYVVRISADGDETWEDCEDEFAESGDVEEIEDCDQFDDDVLTSALEDDDTVLISDPLHETETTAGSSLNRSWRKRKLDVQNGIDVFPCKKVYEENKTAVGGDLGSTSHELPPTNAATAPSTEKKHTRCVIPTKDNPPPEMTGWLSQFERWSNAERLLAIDELIDRCEPTQVRHMMQVIEPQFQRDFISLLPKELALCVLSFLGPEDLLRAAQTCRSWQFLAEDNLLWREKCRHAGITQIIQTDASVPKRSRSSCKSPPIFPIQSSPWKQAFMRQHAIEMNWRIKPIRPPKVLKGHDDHVITCLQFCGNRIVSGSDDNTLKVWSASTGKCLRTLVGHTGGVWSSQMAGSIIISGSTDRTLKVWNAESGACIHTLYGHTSTVRCMHLHENKVVSGSRDATLRMWDVVSGEFLHVLVGHLAAVRCVQYDGRLVVSGAYDYMVKVWNPEREECLHTLQGHTNRVYSLQFDGVHVVSGSLDTSIRVWEVETGACRHTLMGHQSLTSGMELRNNILVSGNADSTVKVWDIVTGQCLQTLSGANKHQSAVTCLQFNSRFVITSSDDGTVKLWDVRTGAFIRNLVALDSGGSGGVVWRIRANDTKLICAVGSRNGTEETKLLVLDFDVDCASSNSANVIAIADR